MKVSFLSCVKLLGLSGFICIFTTCKDIPKPRTTSFNGKIEGRKLKWDDFVGKPNSDSKYDAFTKWNIYYRYDAPIFEEEKTAIDIRVWAELDPKSWVKANPKADKQKLLNHEQGHYDIAQLCVQELKNAFAEQNFSKTNYQYIIDSVYHEVMHYFLQMERQYDFETDHLYNESAQQKWDEFFQMNLD